ncbi:B3 DNA binding domain [Macleaya cordata]|uniref:B3 DNA binding domain n=1 Tax=Macleaya cordata TaxID=56857 RepID=A0A200R1T3_MACCD|nr:B3 DNA binding domain [Macleaya cordata]
MAILQVLEILNVETLDFGYSVDRLGQYVKMAILPIEPCKYSGLLLENSIALKDFWLPENWERDHVLLPPEDLRKIVLDPGEWRRRATSSIKWRKGWDLRCGGFANLCDKCGFAYEQLFFCDTFHLKESGWRECSSCGKRLHCGCIASKSLLELLDDGSVECISCMKSSHSSMPSDEKPYGFSKMDGHSIDVGKILQMGKHMEGNEQNSLLQSLKNDSNGYLSQIKIEQDIPSVGEVGFTRPPVARPEATKDMLHVARPTVEGRGRNQLLPRYWPRLTEQELQQISGHSKSTIVPLFEKVLTASDASRIGRLVLPKACAEAYFPRLSLPEGLPLRIQDAKGNDWVFQFRFWPNNNSRMYVLEGIAPCIQSMQLEAGDTVTFSRIDPEGKLLMGFRKASTSNSVALQVIPPDICSYTLRSHGCGKTCYGVPDDVSPKELENLLRLNMDFKKRRITANEKAAQEHEASSGLDTLATTAVLGENWGDSNTPSVLTTSKHPRHRLGCTCIVCIQSSPSGKGPKHKPTRTCK